MAINFEKISSVVNIPQTPPKKTRTVLEEINERQALLAERVIKCKDIGRLYTKVKKDPHQYTFKYFCVCPRFNPQHICKHKGNIIIDRDVLTKEEHIVYLATPKADLRVPHKMPKFFQKKFIVPNCTARINKLAAPDLKQVNDTLKNYEHVISKRHKRSLRKHLEKRPPVEYTSIETALNWLEEEKRLKAVAKKVQKSRCKKMCRKIVYKQRTQIKKIICILFEEMKEFLLNDQFIMDENSTLVSVILETLKDFTDKEFYITGNLQEYQKILAFNLAVWINKFISNLNIHVAEPPAHYPQMPQTQPERPTQEMESFLPVGDYISCSSGYDCYEEEDEDEDYYSYKRSNMTQSEDEKAAIKFSQTPIPASSQQ